MIYRPEITGLRAIAVLAVIFFHFGLDKFKGGYIGVDIFFVISGYLITTIIFDDLAKNRFSALIFYTRRARRILPALLFVMLISILPAWVLLAPDELKNFSKSLISVVFFISNIFFWAGGGYFETSSELKPMLHTWSLSIEEQYYIFFPALLTYLCNFKKKYKEKTVFLLLLLITFISFTVAQLGSIYKPSANFFLLQSRVWEFGIGSIIAIHLISRNTVWRLIFKQILSLTGFTFICISIFFFDSKTPYPSFYTALPTIGAALIILFAEKETYIGKMLSSSLLVFIGSISYSAYLWHQPIFAFAKISENHLGESSKLILLTATLLLSFFTWKYIETPFRSINKFNDRKILFGLTTTSLLIVAISYWTILTNFNHEVSMAKNLSESIAVYTSNIDDRKFIKARIQIETNPQDVIILGSSRLMQLNSDILNHAILNLSISRASLEDYVAIYSLLSNKFLPKTVYIGVDPWLFNSQENDNQRWKSYQNDYISGLNMLGARSNLPTTKAPDLDNVDTLLAVYRALNISTIPSLSSTPDKSRDKILKDGSRVYSLFIANRNYIDTDQSIADISALMHQYYYSTESEDLFIKLISHIKEKHQVILVLTPFHPNLYKYIELNDPRFIGIESKFRNISKNLNLPIIGSYNPKEAGCFENEFYDGVHPKSSCIDKIIRSQNPTSIDHFSFR